MATTTVNTTVINVTVTMTIEEAEAVAAVFARVYGDPDKSRRGYVESVLTSMKSAGIEYDTSDMEGRVMGTYPCIGFSNRDDL